jgi:hypothetical protein
MSGYPGTLKNEAHLGPGAHFIGVYGDDIPIIHNGRQEFTSLYLGHALVAAP